MPRYRLPRPGRNAAWLRRQHDDEPGGRPDDWEPGEGSESEFCDWVDPDDEVEPQPEPGDFWYEPESDDD